MFGRSQLIILTIATGLTVGACGGARPDVTAPDAVAALPESQQARDVPPPGSIDPLPPPVERGPAPPREEAPPSSGSCDPAPAQWAIGRAASKAVLEQAQAAAGAAVARFLRPNEPITMEWLGSRLNLELDEGDVVRAVRCG